ncbi:hypothetical protein JKA74_13560 [Marivirga sp. S37H4]|uniref:DUF3575 domain-containing protein n=1 Tax=Marivirga aurantiaca TaxID=2802615 RepID=A0A935C9I6_9BACT|nr:hypothetical protein [Marivirga aurantiaca]MBK6266065.1 hypothetical protein [Marivirga aurantiaca]
MKLKLILSILVFTFAFTKANSQTQPQDSTYKKFFVGSTLFILGNFIPDDPNAPDFAQLSFGYRLTSEDVISVEANTWKYAWPLGIPFGVSYQAPEEKYPGYIREFGIAFVYQRFIWKGAYTAIHAMNALQRYVDEDNRKIQNGYQLFMTYRLGYHFELFKNRLFIEPSLAITHWPVNTNVPQSFAELESKWPNYFLLEPGLHFGIKF